MAVAGAAFEELSQTGELGAATLDLLRRMARQVTRTSSFPPPEGHARWNDDAVDDLLTDMLSRPGAGQRFVLTCFAKATDEQSLERLFLASIRNFLIDQAKMTPRGKLRRRIASRLAADDRFQRVPGTSPRWTLASSPPGAVWQGDIEDLLSEAWQVRDVVITRWNRSGPTPAATVDALMTVVTQVLQHAAGAVREEDLARTLEGRFELLAPAEFTSLYTGEGALADPTAQLPGGPQTDPSSDEARAGEIWLSLSADERTLLPYLDLDAHHAAQLLKVGPLQASAVLAGLHEKLRLALSDDSQRHHVMAALLRFGTDPPPDAW